MCHPSAQAACFPMMPRLDGRSFEHICHIRLAISERHDRLFELKYGRGGVKARRAPALIALCALEFDPTCTVPGSSPTSTTITLTRFRHTVSRTAWDLQQDKPNYLTYGEANQRQLRLRAPILAFRRHCAAATIHGARRHPCSEEAVPRSDRRAGGDNRARR
jgi:hypothetical protein